MTTTRTSPLRGRTVFITGAARGIGEETARRVAGRGANVALVGLEPERLERVAWELGEQAAWFEADVRDWKALEKATAGAVERFGGIDVVFANAGIARVGTVESIEPQDFEDTIEVNLLGVWRTVRTTLPHVIARRGYVLIMSSMAAHMHLALMASYATAKAGVHALADSLRMELEPLGVAVGAAYLGFIDTDMVRDAYADPRTVDVRSRGGAVFFTRPLPIGIAGKAIVEGMERRRRWIVVPRHLRPLLHSPARFQRIAEAYARRQRLIDPLVARDDTAH
jgi:NAD(P)-dependent dehydrogenase (short-subunit alcohol dehydrogenase family)